MQAGVATGRDLGTAGEEVTQAVLVFGKWLFRSHDANDLLKAARDREEPPCCS